MTAAWMGDSLNPDQVYRLPDGTFWSIRTADFLPVEHNPELDVTIFFDHHAITRGRLRLRAQSQLNDASMDPEQLVREAIVEILDDNLQAITKEGALTMRESARRGRRPNPRSVDYITSGLTLMDHWHLSALRQDPSSLVASLIVRRCPVDGDIPGIVTVNGFTYLAVTMTERSDLWRGVLRGDPLPGDHATYLIPPGGTFDLAEHCDFVADHQHPIFARSV